MGEHRDPWALEIIEQISALGKSLNYVTASTELRITRGWVDVCWMWDIGILPSPLYLLVAEVETSKSDWPRIRSNAAKAVGLKPLIYAHIFKPSITLTAEERQQLVDLHPGRHVLIIDGTTKTPEQFAHTLVGAAKSRISHSFNAFVMVKLHATMTTEQRASLRRIEGVSGLYETFGSIDVVITLQFSAIENAANTVPEIARVLPNCHTSTLVAIPVLP